MKVPEVMEKVLEKNERIIRSSVFIGGRNYNKYYCGCRA
jgi:hypothetical protein